MIPLVDLQAQYASLRSEITAAINPVLEKAAFVGGEEVKRFEAEFAAYCSTAGCVGVGNGTDALMLALRALGIGPGDEVITVAHTFIATAEAITSVGARPVFVDVLPDTLLMAPEHLERAISPRSRAIIPVHLYGQPCDMEAITNLARRHDLAVVEDAAQAHGAFYQGRRVGSLGKIACFSFYPGKNQGAYGDGGAVVSDDLGILTQVRKLANHGRLEKYTHEMPGINSRLDGLQAAVLRVKLRHLDRWNAARAGHAAEYLRLLQGSCFGLPVVDSRASSVWHLFVIQTDRREALRAALRKRGFDSGIHYPLPLHLQPAYQDLGLGRGSLPVTERAAERILSLPMYPELPREALNGLVESLLAFDREGEPGGRS